MKLVSHPNVVDLKAFFYTNGDKVPLSDVCTVIFFIILFFSFCAEGRSVSQPHARICTRNSLPRKSPLRQTQTAHAHVTNQIVHVSTPALPRIHSFRGDMPPRH